MDKSNTARSFTTMALRLCIIFPTWNSNLWNWELRGNELYPVRHRMAHSLKTLSNLKMVCFFFLLSKWFVHFCSLASIIPKPRSKREWRSGKFPMVKGVWREAVSRLTGEVNIMMKGQSQSHSPTQHHHPAWGIIKLSL